ncbi:cytochrome P450 [Glomus cerebriforme]|uniref:Cytochrome P450 n=1 Tax=Glomus cerebriforme TaxID=658196 RepID=A0A397SZD4_9GLOM|nr:cytochrome P450 [Glomus cerebriforme]
MILELFKISDYIGIIVSIILLYVAKFYYQYFTRTNPLPGPIPLPLIGNSLQMIYYVKGDMVDYYKFLHQRYGDIYELYIGNFRQVVLARPEYIEKLMSTSKQSHNVLRVGKTGLEDLGLGPMKGIAFNTYIPTWKSNRQFLLHTIQIPNFSNEVMYNTSKTFDELNSYWKSIGYGVPIDFVNWARLLTYELVFQIIMGFKINKLVEYFNDNVEVSKKKDFRPSSLDKEITNLHESILENLPGLMFVLSYPSFIRRTLFKKKNDAMFYNKHRTNEMLSKIINYRRKEIEETPINEELRNDMLTTLIITNTERDFNEKHYIANESSEPLTNDQILQILIEAVAGGSDSIAHFLCFVVYYLGHYPNVLARFRQELDLILGSDPNRQITTDDLSKMHYLDALIKESARFINQTKIIQRVSTSTSEVAGYKWSPDTTFIIYVEGIHLNPNYYKNPHEFNPDRFMGDKPQKNTFLMFGGGMRTCPGKKFALTEVKCLITLIFRSLDVSLVDKNAPVKLMNAFTTSCTELMVKINQREVQI